MRHTISQLFDALHYCNKFVKTEFCTDEVIKKDFYAKKRDLIYHIIKNHKIFQISIDECRIEEQKSIITDGVNKLYAFALTKDNKTLKVHQKKSNKLDTLLKFLDISIDGICEYHNEIDNDLIFDETEFSKCINIINKFYIKWRLHQIANNLSDNKVTNKMVFDSYAYYYPDFSFYLEDGVKKIKNGDIIKITHKKTKKIYKLQMGNLRCRGNQFLNYWRTNKSGKDFFKNILIH